MARMRTHEELVQLDLDLISQPTPTPQLQSLLFQYPESDLQPFIDQKWCYQLVSYVNTLTDQQKEFFCVLCHGKQEDIYGKPPGMCPLETHLWGRVHDKGEVMIGKGLGVPRMKRQGLWRPEV